LWVPIAIPPHNSNAYVFRLPGRAILTFLPSIQESCHAQIQPQYAFPGRSSLRHDLCPLAWQDANEGLHGAAFSGYSTNFPQVIGMGATWDTQLVHRMGEITSTEARTKYNEAMRHEQQEQFFGLTFWAPNINIFRDPRWGRGQET
jgi:beta-glucosidase-like glycosyl hydrolase